MKKEFAVFFQRGEDQMSPGKTAVAAVKFDSDITLYGDRSFVEAWAPYFASDSWTKHKQQDEAPLVRVLGGKMMPIRFVDEAAFKSAVAGLRVRPVIVLAQ
jgi:hypothetical protein